MSSRARATHRAISGLADSDIDQLVIQLARWRTRMDQLLDATLALGVNSPVDGRDVLTHLTTKFGVASAMLGELRAAGGSRWPVFKPGIERAWSELEDALALLTAGAPSEREPVAATADESPEDAR